MGKACEICGVATSSRGLIRHNKEKHSTYYKLYLRLTVLKGIVAGVAGASLLVLFSQLNDVSLSAFSFSVKILAPTAVLLVAIVWVAVTLYLRKVRKSLNPSKK